MAKKFILLAVIAAIFAIVLRPLDLLYLNLPPFLSVLAFGIGILGAAFLITWTAEATQSYVRNTLVVVFVALIAVLPEYAVDMVFTGKAAVNLQEYGSYPMANMTGANRLLIGIGWPLILFVAWLRTKKGTIVLEKRHAVELIVLLLASLYAFVIWAKGELALFDGAVLGGLFFFYLWVSSRILTEMPEPKHGPAHIILLEARKRGKSIFGILFLFAALAIGVAAEPFSEGLLESGRRFGIEEFLLVQWLAPLASEAPEITIATIFAASLLAAYGFGILLSSKINQWTLLVGMIPIVFTITRFFSHGSFDSLPLDARQREEIFLTASQSIFALTVLSNLRFRWYEAGTLCVLFLAQLTFPSPEMRMFLSFLYLGLTGAIFAKGTGTAILAKNWKRPFVLVEDAWNTIRNGDQP